MIPDYFRPAMELTWPTGECPCVQNWLGLSASSPSGIGGGLPFGQVVPKGANSQDIKLFLEGATLRMHRRLYAWRLKSLNDFPSLMSLVLDTRPKTSELHSKVTSGGRSRQPGQAVYPWQES